MDMAERQAFRKSFMGGFSKKDVNKYIEETTLNYEEKLRRTEEKFLEADKDREELSAKLREAEEKLEDISPKYDDLLAKVAELEAALAAKNEELSAKTELLAKSNEKAEELSERVAILTEIKDEYVSRKAELAEIELAARVRANGIVAEAEEESEEKRKAVDAELEEKKADFDREIGNVRRDTGDAIDGVSSMVHNLRLDIDGMGDRINAITETVRESVSTLFDAVCDAQDKVEGIRSRLDSEKE